MLSFNVFSKSLKRFQDLSANATFCLNAGSQNSNKITWHSKHYSTYSCVKYEKKRRDTYTTFLSFYSKLQKLFNSFYDKSWEKWVELYFCVVSSLSLFRWFFFMVCVKFSGEMFALTISLNALFQSDARLKKK